MIVLGLLATVSLAFADTNCTNAKAKAMDAAKSIMKVNGLSIESGLTQKADLVDSGEAAETYRVTSTLGGKSQKMMIILEKPSCQVYALTLEE